MRRPAAVILIASLLILSIAVPAFAGPFEDGMAAYNRGDYSKARGLFLSLAKQGNSQAQYSLGSMYISGQGVRKDYAEAAKWWRKAAEQGHPSAQLNLGFRYANGQGVPQDYVHAHMLFDLAASRYPASEVKNRNDAWRFRDTIASKMTPAQIAEAQRLALEWKPKNEQK